MAERVPETGAPARENDGVQIKVWLPSGFYDVLKARATRNHTSVAAEARQLMQVGLANLRPAEDLAEAVTAIRRYLELHLEPLAFIAAMDAAFGAESWRYQFGAAYKDQAAALDRMLRERAAARVKRQLRDIESDAGVHEDDDENGAS